MPKFLVRFSGQSVKQERKVADSAFDAAKEFVEEHGLGNEEALHVAVEEISEAKYFRFVPHTDWMLAGVELEDPIS